MVRLLLITTLYPAYPNQSALESTRAVHQFAREWAVENAVDVIRLWPYYPSVFGYFENARAARQFAYKEKFILEDVNVTRIPILKVPKMSFRRRDIERVAKQVISLYDEKYHPDIIVCDMLNPSIFIASLIGKTLGSRVVASLHNSDILFLSKRSNFMRYSQIDRHVHKIIFRSKKIADGFLALYDGYKNEDDWFTLPFGIEKTEIIDRDKLELKIKGARRTILVAASLKKLKKIDVLIDAFARVENRQGYMLRIVGDGPERTALQNSVDDLGISNCVRFEGELTRDEVLKHMEESNIFAMVSSPETFGLVYVEAMAKGCVTIGSKGEGIDGVIVHGKNGFLCEPDDVESLRRILVQAISLSEDDRAHMIRNAVSTASSLTVETLSRRYLDGISPKSVN